MKIHVIEDEQDQQKAIAFYLESDGFEVTKSSTGATAVEETLQAKPDAIVLDMILPVKSGLDVLQELRQKGCNVPVIVFTNLNVSELDQERLQNLKVLVALLKVDTRLSDLSDVLMQLSRQKQ